MDRDLDDRDTLEAEGHTPANAPQQPEPEEAAVPGDDAARDVSATDECDSLPHSEAAVELGSRADDAEEVTNIPGPEAFDAPIPVLEQPPDAPFIPEPPRNDVAEDDDSHQPAPIDKGKGKEVQPPKPATSSTPAPAHTFPGTGTTFSIPAPGTVLPWELDPERPDQKLPILFKDAVGRNFMIPWRRAKTWEGMKMTIDKMFEKVDGPFSFHVPSGHYDLFFTSSPMREVEGTTTNNQNGTHRDGPPSSSEPGPSTLKTYKPIDNNSNIGNSKPSSSTPSTSNTPAKAVTPPGTTGNPPPYTSRSAAPIIVLPDFWEDIIRPGMSVTMAMWSMTNSTPFAQRPFPGPSGGGGRGMNHTAPPPPGMNNNGMLTVPPPPAPFQVIHVGERPGRRRGKTRVNPGRPVHKRSI